MQPLRRLSYLDSRLPWADVAIPMTMAKAESFNMKTLKVEAVLFDGLRA